MADDTHTGIWRSSPFVVSGEPGTPIQEPPELEWTEEDGKMADEAAWHAERERLLEAMRFALTTLARVQEKHYVGFGGRSIGGEDITREARERLSRILEEARNATWTNSPGPRP